MALAGVDHQAGRRARQALSKALRFGSIARRSCETSLPSISPKAAGLEEVTLHVDDQQGGLLGQQAEPVGFGGDLYGLVHRSALWLAARAAHRRAQAPVKVCRNGARRQPT